MCEYNKYYNRHYCNEKLKSILLLNIILCIILLLITLIFISYKLYFKKWKTYNKKISFYEFALITYVILISIRLLYLFLIYIYNISSYIIFLDEIWFVFILIAKKEAVKYCFDIIGINNNFKVDIKFIKKLLNIYIFTYIIIIISIILIDILKYNDNIKTNYILFGIRKIIFCLGLLITSLSIFICINKTYNIYNNLFTNLNDNIDNGQIFELEKRKKKIIKYYLMLFYFTIFTLILFIIFLIIESFIMIINYEIFLNNVNITIWYFYYFFISISLSIIIIFIYCGITLKK